MNALPLCYNCVHDILSSFHVALALPWWPSGEHVGLVT